MARRPTVSVIVETYNLTEAASKSSLTRAVRAAVEQAEHFDSEVIIAGSALLPRSVTEVLEELGPSVRLLDVDTDHYDALKRRAVEAAHGEFVVFLDGDCEPGAGWLRAHVDALQSGAMATAGITRYRGGWWADVTSVLDFGFLYDADPKKVGCYASNNAGFRREIFLACPPDGRLRCNCYLHAQELLRRGTPMELVSGASVVHDRLPFLVERLRRGSDIVDAARQDRTVPESRWLGRPTLVPRVFVRCLTLDHQRLTQARERLGMSRLAARLGFLAIVAIRFVDMLGVIEAVIRPGLVRRPPRPVRTLGVPPERIEGPSVSVCIVTAARPAQLSACLDALAGQTAVPELEVLVGGNGDESVRQTVAAVYPSAKVIDIARTNPGAARNALLEYANGEVLLFLDDDVVAPADLMRNLVDVVVEHPECDVFGGPNETPPRSGAFETVQGAVLASRVGSANARHRFGGLTAGPADDRHLQLCNLAVRRRVMQPFEDGLVCAEENALLHTLAQAGVAMWHDPRLTVWHDRRHTVRTFATQAHKFGCGRGQLMRRRPETFRVSYLAPSALVLWLLAVPVLARRSRAALVAPALYGAGVSASSAVIALRLRKPGAAPRAAFLTALLHAAYGTGVLRGLLSPRRVQASRRRSSRVSGDRKR